MGYTIISSREKNIKDERRRMGVPKGKARTQHNTGKEQNIMMGIEEIFENYKASSNQETSMSEEQEMSFNLFSDTLEKLHMGASKEEYQKQQQIFDSAVSYARASEKSGFVEGFKTAMRIMRECQN